jgi:Zn-finger nucleic acid-binding protein
MFIGSKHCQRCGAAAARQREIVASGQKCPRCKTSLQLASIGASRMLECSSCLGLWLDTTTFEKISADREQQATILGTASLTGIDRSTGQARVSYVPCPECTQLMNRANFARCSGVIIDLCKQHGIWFDRDELSRIIEFIRSGGLDVSRAKEKASLEEERRKLRQDQLRLDMDQSKTLGIGDSHETKILGIASTRDLLKFLID